MGFGGYRGMDDFERVVNRRILFVFERGVCILWGWGRFVVFFFWLIKDSSVLVFIG